jgi:hypothetical protein
VILLAEKVEKHCPSSLDHWVDWVVVWMMSVFAVAVAVLLLLFFALVEFLRVLRFPFFGYRQSVCHLLSP